VNQRITFDVRQRGTVIHEMIHDMTNIGHVEGTTFATHEKDFAPTITTDIIKGILEAAGSSQKFAICSPTNSEFFQNGTVTGNTVNFAPNFEEIKNGETNKAKEMKDNAKNNIKNAAKEAKKVNEPKRKSNSKK
jgi:hypothetical protein